jgi:hypothetical protein
MVARFYITVLGTILFIPGGAGGGEGGGGGQGVVVVGEVGGGGSKQHSSPSGPSPSPIRPSPLPYLRTINVKNESLRRTMILSNLMHPIMPNSKLTQREWHC